MVNMMLKIYDYEDVFVFHQVKKDDLIKLDNKICPYGVEYPLTFYASEQVICRTIPNSNRVPEKHCEGDFVIVPLYQCENLEKDAYHLMMAVVKNKKPECTGTLEQVQETLQKKLNLKKSKAFLFGDKVVVCHPEVFQITYYPDNDNYLYGFVMFDEKEVAIGNYLYE